ncbi:hypothetical protein ACHQM5_020285 [Ranunculus cassubicifolius]
MAKGDDALRRKKNKQIRKRMRADTDSSSKVSARVAAIIASKQRRKNGKRRMCEGMCFSLPSLEDPFNETHGKKNPDQKNGQKTAGATKKDGAPKKDVSNKQRDAENDSTLSRKGKEEVLIKGGAKKRRIHVSSDSPSKFLTMCLRTIQKKLLEDKLVDGSNEHPLLLNKWGAEFYECSLLGTDILDTSGSCSSVEQIAWMVSIAADIITKKENEGLTVPNPFLLILVPSQEKAIEVRSLCKPLKPLGIHTVSIHTGASVDHQVQGLKSCEPEFLVSTPERLLELVSLKAIDISGLSFLVIDGVEAFAKAGSVDHLKSVTKLILEPSLQVVFCDSFGAPSISVVRTFLGGPISRLSVTDSVASQSACISQYIHKCASDEKASKGMKILNEEHGKRLSCNVLFVGGAENCSSLLTDEGYSVSEETDDTYTKETCTVTVSDVEHIEGIDMEDFEVVILTSFPSEIEDYVKIITGMGRQSVNGALHCCFSEEDAPMAGELIEILQLCHQSVPKFLEKWQESSAMLEG